MRCLILPSWVITPHLHSTVNHSRGLERLREKISDVGRDKRFVSRMCHDRSISAVAWLGECPTILLSAEIAVMTHTELFLTCTTVLEYGSNRDLPGRPFDNRFASLLVLWLPYDLLHALYLAVAQTPSCGGKSIELNAGCASCALRDPILLI